MPPPFGVIEERNASPVVKLPFYCSSDCLIMFHIIWNICPTLLVLSWNIWGLPQNIIPNNVFYLNTPFHFKMDQMEEGSVFSLFLVNLCIRWPVTGLGLLSAALVKENRQQVALSLSKQVERHSSSFFFHDISLNFTRGTRFLN